MQYFLGKKVLFLHVSALIKPQKVEKSLKKKTNQSSWWNRDLFSTQLFFGDSSFWSDVMFFQGEDPFFY